jgi:hypothetical protein
VYEKVPIEPGTRAVLQGLQKQSFLNDVSIHVIEYMESSDRYLIRPCISLEDAQKIATTGTMIVDSKNLLCAEQEVRIWTFACLYSGSQPQQHSDQDLACSFLEKILVIAQPFCVTSEWQQG